MEGKEIIFYLLSVLTLGCGLLAVTARKIFRAAIYLLFSLVGIAGIYFWLEYEFIAAVQIIVYVGGIVVLIIFSIFLTQQSGSELPKASAGRKIFAGLASIFGFAFAMSLLNQYSFKSTTGETVIPSVENIGMQMLGVDEHGYALPFEVVSILLLAAMVGCIVIAIKAKPIRE